MAHYPPELVASLASEEQSRAITVTASDGCAELGFTNETVWDVLADLSGPSCRFYKTMPSTSNPKEILDVYDVWVENTPIYLKFKIITKQNGASLIVVVLSFKRNEHYL